MVETGAGSSAWWTGAVPLCGDRQMAGANEPGSDVVPSVRAERKRMLFDDTAGIVIYATVLALISSVVVAIVVLA